MLLVTSLHLSDQALQPSYTIVKVQKTNCYIPTPIRSSPATRVRRCDDCSPRMLHPYTYQIKPCNPVGIQVRMSGKFWLHPYTYQIKPCNQVSHPCLQNSMHSYIPTSIRSSPATSIPAMNALALMLHPYIYQIKPCNNLNTKKAMVEMLVTSLHLSDQTLQRRYREKAGSAKRVTSLHLSDQTLQQSLSKNLNSFSLSYIPTSIRSNPATLDDLTICIISLRYIPTSIRSNPATLLFK